MIEVRELSKSYGATRAVDHLSFTVQPGKVTGFLGPNGAGKSTTMRVILGLDRPDGGSATIGGRRYQDLERPLCVVGALLEARAVHSGRSAYDHLLVLAQTQHLPRRRVDEVIDLIGLGPVARKRAGDFSLGMSQRLGLAAALLGNPSVLMLDEPVNGLDPEGIHWIRTFMRRLAAEGRTIFVSSHLMSEMALTADHLIVIGKGRLLADCPTTEFIERSSHHSVLVRSPDKARLSAAIAAAGGEVTDAIDGGFSVTGLEAPSIGELAAREGLVLHELTPQMGSLEEAFMEVTNESVEFGTQALAPARVPAVSQVPAQVPAAAGGSTFEMEIK